MVTAMQKGQPLRARVENSGEGTGRESRVSSTTLVYENGCVSEQSVLHQWRICPCVLVSVQYKQCVYTVVLYHVRIWKGEFSSLHFSFFNV